MLCPSCRRAAPGGVTCPQCGATIPERETFSGQGDHYWRVLLLFSLIFTIGFLFFANYEHSLDIATYRFWGVGWMWPYIIFLLVPNGIGAYYWFMLREEEITVTDEYIARRSHWGDERLAWSDVQGYYRQPMLFRQTRLGRVAGLSRFFTQHRIMARIPTLGYDLIGPPTADGEAYRMQLEPGTIEDMPWLLALIEERLGPPLDTLLPSDAP